MSFFPLASTALKNLFSRPATRLYPAVKREPFPGTRGNLSIDFSQCILCGMCDRRCPANAITVSKEGRSWSVNHLSCVSCSCCVTVCPKKCLKLDPHASPALPASRKADGVETHVAPPAPPKPAAAAAPADKGPETKPDA